MSIQDPRNWPAPSAERTALDTGMGSAGQITKATVREATEVNELPTRLELALANLQSTLDAHAARLAPILLPATPAETRGPNDEPARPEQSEVSRRLENVVYVINALSNRVLDLTRHLDLSDPEEF